MRSSVIKFSKVVKKYTCGGKRMLLVIEGLAMCFLMLLVCVVGIANGPVGGVYFYEKEVQDRFV